MPPHKQEEITFKYEKTASLYITPEHTKEIDEVILQSIFSEILEDEMFLYKNNKKHTSINYDIKLHRINETDIFKVSFKSDTEELSTEVCDFIVDGLCKKVENVVGYNCSVIDYAR